MAWQWAENQWKLGELPNRGPHTIFPNINLTGLYVQKRIIIYRYIFHSSGFHHICNIKCRVDCCYFPQNIFNAKNFNPHKKPTSLLNVPICTQGMQRTWWPEAGTIIVTGHYCNLHKYTVSKLTCYLKQTVCKVINVKIKGTKLIKQPFMK